MSEEGSHQKKNKQYCAKSCHKIYMHISYITQFDNGGLSTLKKKTDKVKEESVVRTLRKNISRFYLL
jgi:hypothetical protein